MKNRWRLAAAIGLPLSSMTAYLLWIWPRPRGSSLIAQTGPYVLTLLTGLPFVWGLTGRPGRVFFVLAFVVGGFVLLWLYALLVLCAARGVCL
jgi:hypothetical protein